MRFCSTKGQHLLVLKDFPTPDLLPLLLYCARSLPLVQYSACPFAATAPCPLPLYHLHPLQLTLPRRCRRALPQIQPQ